MDSQFQHIDRIQLFIGGLLLVVIAGAVGFWLGGAIPPPGRAGEAEGSEARAEASAVTLSGGNAIAVSDQLPGVRVEIPLVTLAADGWVVIHEDLDGKPGRILGAQRFNAGQNQTGAVDLLRGIEGGRVYYAMLHADDGDRAFDHTRDLPLRDPQGNVIVMRFVASSQPAR